METKKCTKCGEEKELNEFPNCKTGKNGKHSACKKCHRQYQRDRYASSPEKVKASVKSWDAANKERRNSKRSALREANPEKVKAARSAQKSRDVINLSSYYVAGLMGLATGDCTPELIELKREQLRIHRLTKQLKQEIQNV